MTFAKLGDLFSITSGGTPSRKKDSYYQGGTIPWIKTGDLHHKYIEQASEYITPEGLKNSSAKMFPIGTVLIAMYGATIGACSILKISACTNQACAAFLPNKAVNKIYLYYFLLSIRPALIKAGVGGAQPNISATYLKKIDIPLLPLKTQEQIAAILEKADNLRKQCQQVEQNLTSLSQSVFLEMFGDPITNPNKFIKTTIRDIISSVNYGTSEKASENKGDYPILRMNNITYNGEWDFTSLKYINLKESQIEKYQVKKGDLLFNRTNSKELVGKTAVYREEKCMVIAGYLIRVRFNEKANAEYIAGYLNSVHGKATLKNMCKSIIGMANINAQELQDISILLPPKALQDKYAKFVSSLLTVKKDNNKKKIACEELFNELLQQAFNEKLNLKLAKTSFENGIQDK